MLRENCSQIIYQRAVLKNCKISRKKLKKKPCFGKGVARQPVSFIAISKERKKLKTFSQKFILPLLQDWVN